MTPQLTGFIGITDARWNEFHRQRAPSTVNFWQPGGSRAFKAVAPGEPFIFRSNKRHGGRITGFGFFAAWTPMTAAQAWLNFETANGADTAEEFFGSLARLRRSFATGARDAPSIRNHVIGNIVLTTPVFFDPADWIEGPAGWPDNVVAGMRFDLAVGEGRRIWEACRALSLATPAHRPMVEANLELLDGPKFGSERRVMPRLGQGAFRAVVIETYKRACAVSGEHSLPVLEAAHIRPYSGDGTHTVNNGLLLRSDIHRLFDLGYVTVTPDYTFKVGDRLREEFNNGRAYYGLNGQKIHLPNDTQRYPDREALDWHARERFAG